MTVEILFSEVCNLYGDGQNAKYLELCLPQAEFIYTPLDGEPYFKDNTPDMIYIGSMSENVQRSVIKKLWDLRERITELTDNGCVILATGNACEIFTKSIEYVSEKLTAQGLGLFDFTVKTNLFDRYNGKVLGEFEGLEITGFRSQFSFIYGDNSENYFLKVLRGDGLNRESKLEGFRKNNFIGTQLLGPILPLNPLFCEYLFSLMGEKTTAAFREEALDAYYQRLREFKSPKTVF